MPTLKKRQPKPEGDQSKWYIVTPGADHPFTFQIKPEGYKWLLVAGLGHKSDLDWDVFKTLRSLGLLYTLNSSDNPSDAPTPDDLSFEEIPIKERVRLGEGLLSRFTTTKLSSQEGTLQFLLSFGDLNEEFQLPILERILSGTPFDASVVSNCSEVFKDYEEILHQSYSNYNPVLIALILGVAYSVIDPIDEVETIGEGGPIWTYDGWIVCAGTELIFYAVRDVITDALPDPLFLEIVESVESVTESHFYSFLEQEFAALSEVQFIVHTRDLNPQLGSIVGDGLKAKYPQSILILPGADTKENRPFEIGN